MRGSQAQPELSNRIFYQVLFFFFSQFRLTVKFLSHFISAARREVGWDKRNLKDYCTVHVGYVEQTSIVEIPLVYRNTKIYRSLSFSFFLSFASQILQHGNKTGDNVASKPGNLLLIGPVFQHGSLCVQPHVHTGI